MALKTKPLPKPTPPSTPLAPDVAALGPPVTPIERLQLMSVETFENLICDWVYSLGKYARIEKLAGLTKRCSCQWEESALRNIRTASFKKSGRHV